MTKTQKKSLLKRLLKHRDFLLKQKQTCLTPGFIPSDQKIADHIYMADLVEEDLIKS